MNKKFLNINGEYFGYSDIDTTHGYHSFLIPVIDIDRFESSLKLINIPKIYFYKTNKIPSAFNVIKNFTDMYTTSDEFEYTIFKDLHIFSSHFEFRLHGKCHIMDKSDFRDIKIETLLK